MNYEMFYKEKQIGGSSSRTSDEIYSTEEVWIGRWIDGKPLYRKVIQLKSPPSYGDNQLLKSIDVSFNIRKFSAYLIQTDGIMIQLPYDYKTYDIMIYVSAENKLYINITSSLFTNCPLTVILEYTKTTDSATTIYEIEHNSIMNDNVEIE